MANLKILIFVNKSWLNKLKIDCIVNHLLIWWKLIRKDLRLEELEQFEDWVE
jgi:hypothetical protein